MSSSPAQAADFETSSKQDKTRVGGITTENRWIVLSRRMSLDLLATPLIEDFRQVQPSSLERSPRTWKDLFSIWGQGKVFKINDPVELIKSEHLHHQQFPKHIFQVESSSKIPNENNLDTNSSKIIKRKNNYVSYPCQSNATGESSLENGRHGFQGHGHALLMRD